MSRITNRLSTGLAALTVFVLSAPTAAAGGGGGAGGVDIASAKGLEKFLNGIAALFTGDLGIAIGVIAFAAVGVYIMYARQTGQAVGSVAKVFIGLLILYGGAAMVTEIGGAVTGGAF